MKMSRELRQARDYEEQESAKVTESVRPEYHFSPRIGWLNDPNGLSYYRGQYHLFYQYHPYSTYWGPMHWGHAVSADMVSWEYEPCALAPDSDYDIAGCFSGSAAILPDGRQLLMYTGCSGGDSDPLGKGRWLQSQCVAVSEIQEDGSIEYIKYDRNPVIDEADLPDDCDAYEFRDPYIWRASDGTYRAIAAAGRTGRTGDDGNYIHEKGTQLLLFWSSDGFSWAFDKVLFEDRRRIGVMWECPNFFELSGRHVLIASPMDMKAEADEAIGSVRFPQGNNVCSIVGDYDEETGSFVPDGGYEPVDTGLDFYAPQVLKAPDGRCIMIGWMQDPKTANLHDHSAARIFGQMTVPRELKYKDGKLWQWPVRELKEYRRDKIEYSGIVLHDEERCFGGISGRSLELDVQIASIEKGAPLYREFSIKFAKDEDHFIRLGYRPGRSLLTIDRSHSGQCDEITAQRSSRVIYSDGKLRLRILIDKWSAEIFVNGGEQVASLTYYTPAEAEDIAFTADGSVALEITAYNIRRGK